jgi:putative inorganic carbon (HCO3(-)) transporter
MSSDHTTLKKYIEYVVLSLLTIFLLFSVIFFDDLFYSLLILAIPTFFLLLLILFKDYTKVLFLLILTLPLSIPFSAPNGFTIMFPSEILIAFLSLFIGMRFWFDYSIDRKIVFHPVSVLIIAGLLWDIVCSLLSASPEVSAKRTIVTAVYIIIYYFLLVHLFSDTKNISKVYGLYIIGFLLPILYTLYIHAGLDFMVAPSALISRPFYNDHTIYGAVLAFFIPYLIYSAVKKQDHKRYTIQYLLLSLLFITALFFSYSRAAWLSLLIAGLFFIFMLLKHKLIVSSIIIVLSIISAVFFWETIYETAIESKAISNREDLTEHLQSVTNINSDVSNAERINRWKSALRMFYDKPLTGFGPGTYQFYYGNYQLRSDMTRISTFQGNRGHAHSEYLNRLSETGWPGFLLFISIPLSVFIVAQRVDKTVKDTATKNIARMSVLGLVTFYIHAFFNGFIETDKMAMPVYAAIAAIVVVDIKVKKLK